MPQRVACPKSVYFARIANRISLSTMGIPELPTDAAAAGREARTNAALLATFAAAIFVSAALLFVVQPMFTKMVLPRLGGAPAVWSVAIVFFQGALLVGYGYAHLITRHAPGRTSVVIHLALTVAAVFALPLAIPDGWSRPPAAGEAFWLIGLFAASIGLPFVALAANGPLLQAWFARTNHPHAADPYFLYVASNIGSFLALLSYPVLVEPFVTLGSQTRWWSAGFYLLIALIAACGLWLWRSTDHAPSASGDGSAESAPPGWREAATWVALAAVPSGLLVAVTAHVSTDVAAVPLLWVLPLALYLLTFVIVFARRPVIPHWLIVEAQPLFIIGLILVIVFDPFKNIIGAIAAHLAAFFICVLVCHGELARRRPVPKYLTAFYLWMAAGGMLGGIAATLVAPHVFNWVAEYPILIALAVLCRPGTMVPKHPAVRLAVGGVLAAAALVLIGLMIRPFAAEELPYKWIVGGLLLATVPFWRVPPAFAAIVAFVLIGNHVVAEQGGVLTVRSFFGVAKITESADGEFRILQHGTTMHGAQRIRAATGEPMTGAPEPLLYYHDASGIARAIDAVHARGAGPISMAVIGLGSGSLACRAAPDDIVHFYEIDPAIIRIARDPGLFSFLSACRPDVPITLGDARLTLADAADGLYDIIIVDAFSSDAIPIHLLTREAMAIYLKKLKANGMAVLHISNRHLELASVVAGIAAANGLITRVNDLGEDEAWGPYKYGGTVAAVVRREEDFGALAQAQDWPVTEPDPSQQVWSDDYSNIVGALIRNLYE
jgi:hypothetical protein